MLFDRVNNFLEVLLRILVPSARIELARPYGQQILSLQRLPIPPRGHSLDFFWLKVPKASLVATK